MNVPSWDLFITIFFIVAVGFGFIMQRDKVITMLLSMYAGIVVAMTIAGPLKMFFSGDKTIANQMWVRSNASPFSLQTGLFIAVTVFVTAKCGLSGRSSKGAMSPIEIIAFSFLNSTLALSTIFSFMDPPKRQVFQETSRMARLIIGHSSFWIVAPIILLIVLGAFGRSRGSD